MSTKKAILGSSKPLKNSIISVGFASVPMPPGGSGSTLNEPFVIMSRFGLDGSEAKTLEEIGREMGLTRERVRQIEMAALARLRHTIERRTMTQADLL